MTGLHVEKVDLHVVGVSFEKENQEMQQSQKLALTIEEEKEQPALEESAGEEPAGEAEAPEDEPAQEQVVEIEPQDDTQAEPEQEPAGEEEE